MLVDFRTLEDGALLEADLCVIGAGAAGITLGRELIGSGLTVCLVESGGLEPDADTQDLYHGDVIGRPYYPLDVTRLRHFGGATNHWVGWCTPLDASDFEPKPWLPHSGWPFPRSELEPHYEQAQRVCQLGPYVYDDRLWDRFEVEAPDLNPRRLELCFLQESPPTRFGEVYRAELAQADDVTVLLHANVTDLRTNDAAAIVEHAVIRTLDGKAGRITARAFVVACGGIENARLLLASNRDIEPAGLGNRNGLVGRFFMEHLELVSAIVASDDPYNLIQTFGRRTRDGVLYRIGFRLGEDLRAREGLLNGSAELAYVPDPEAGASAAAALWRDLRRGRVSDEWAARVWRVITDLDGMAGYAYRLLTTRRGDPWPTSVARLQLNALSEQAPNPESRITLSPTERDALGMSRPQLDWRLTATDRRTIEVLTTTIGAEFARLGLGRVRLEEWLSQGGDAWPPDLHGGHHHMGTTRMAEDAGSGVVDRDGRVHAVANLYIAGSSVFPTGGHASPTLTIVALALRLAAHLKGQYGAR